jgi:hypothetical protein
MKGIVAILLLLSLNTSAQWKDFIISVRGDTLNRVDMNGKKQGPWVIHVDELRGESGYDEQGYFFDDKRDGKWVKFSLMGDKLSEENYRWGSLDGRSRYYSRRGGLVREEAWRAIEPGKTFDTVDVLDPADPSKVVDRVVVKVETSTIKHGTWNYYDPEWGTITKTEEYFADKLKSDADAATASGGDDDDDLKPIDFTDNTKKAATAEKASTNKPQAILDYEKKNSGRRKVKVRDGSTGQ